MQKEDNRFVFSVIIPVYNVESYIREAVDSIIGQTLGFEENIQLILVNDGSTDHSGDICKDYQRRYGRNIVYVEKKNEGVSSAKNAGLRYATGRYVNFLDADAWWNKDAFEKVKAFFNDNPDVSIVTGRLVFTGQASGKKHHLDYKYKKTRVVDIYKNYKLPELSCSKSFIKVELLRVIAFDEKLSESDDLLLINTLILREGKYGIVKEAEYAYRRREDKTSASDTSADNLYWHTGAPIESYLGLIERSKELTGELIPYIQNLLVADIQWRLNMPPSGILSEEQRTCYLKNLQEILEAIDDKYITEQRRMPAGSKAYLLRFKYGDGYEEASSTRRAFANTISLRAELLNAEEQLVIEGRAEEKYVGDEYFIYAEDNEKKTFEAEYIDYPVYDKTGVCDNLKIKGQVHRLRLPLKDKIKYSFYITDGSGWRQRLKISHGKLSRLTSQENSFFANDGYIIKSIDNRICVYNRHFMTYLASAYRYDKQLQTKASKELLSIRNEIIRKKMRKHKPVWIISDRSHLAKDNGIALFEHLMKSEYKDRYDIRFLIDRKSEDYEAVKRIGKTVDFGSREHLVMQGLASLIISSNADRWVTNPYVENLWLFRDLLDFKFVFLQHGIIINDLSNWLHKYNKNIRLMTTTTDPERRSIIDGNYGYDESVIKLTGMARYDKLQNSAEKLILFTPTWRQNLAGKYSGDSRRPYVAGFKETDYYKFYNSLINDKRILDVMSDKGYKGLFCIHPAMEAMADDFDGNGLISVETGTDYNDILRRGALMITDYSSVCSDFAYMSKPVIYTQFDRTTFYEGHLYERGYFSYENDGFGSVCYDYESSVEAIVRAINDDCKEPEIYAKRVKNTFRFTDKKNCERITEEILSAAGQLK